MISARRTQNDVASSPYIDRDRGVTFCPILLKQGDQTLYYRLDPVVHSPSTSEVMRRPGVLGSPVCLGSSGEEHRFEEPSVGGSIPPLST